MITNDTVTGRVEDLISSQSAGFVLPFAEGWCWTKVLINILTRTTLFVVINIKVILSYYLIIFYKNNYCNYHTLNWLIFGDDKSPFGVLSHYYHTINWLIFGDDKSPFGVMSHYYHTINWLIFGDDKSPFGVMSHYYHTINWLIFGDEVTIWRHVSLLSHHKLTNSWRC